MNELLCAKNISACLDFYNLTLCRPENDICVKNHGFCGTNDSDQRCFCLPCFTGKYCEEDKVSRNLWSLYTPSYIGAGGITDRVLIGVIFGIFLLLNNVLCLQTYLCSHKIRITNLGVYLSMLAIVSIVIGLQHVVFLLLGFYAKHLPETNYYIKIQCLLYSKYLYPSFLYMYNWFITSAAIERMLIECCKSYSLYDSRRRSIIVSILIIVICPLSTLPNAFTVRQNQSIELYSVQCVNYTPLGYILYVIAWNIHTLAFYILYILMNIIVLGHLLRHRHRFVENDPTFLHSLGVTLNKHKDFFVPYTVQSLGQLPAGIFNRVMTCSMGGTFLVARLALVFRILQVVPFSLTFYFYIYLSPVYMSEFWNSSIIGKVLLKLKEKLHKFSVNSDTLDTHS